MSHLKYLRTLQNIIFKTIRPVRIVQCKSYCDKKTLRINDILKLHKSEEPRRQTESLLFKCDDENEFDISEREREASVASKILKERDRLSSNNKIVLRLCDGFKLTLDESMNVNSEGGDLALDKTISKLKDDAATPPADGPPPKDPIPKKMALVRQDAGPVIWGFIPKEWVTCFYPKTGVSGFFTFLFTVGTYLVSKEIYVLEHNYYGGLSIMIMVWYAVRTLGPPLSKWLDKEIADYENEWNQQKQNSILQIKENLAHEKVLQFQAEGNLMLVEAKRENVALQLEDEFRKRQMYVYEEVRRLLDYQVAVGQTLKKIQQKNLVQYVENAVRKSVTPEMHNALIDGSLESLLMELNKAAKELPDSNQAVDVPKATEESRGKEEPKPKIPEDKPKDDKGGTDDKGKK